MKIDVFNPEANTYRMELLEKLVAASVYPRRWPSWLEEKVDRLGRLGLNKREICERILNKNNTYIKMHGLGRKIQNRNAMFASSMRGA